MIQTARVKPGVESGLKVILATGCPVDIDFDGPLEVLSYLSDGRTALNDKELDREVLREEVAGRMTTRNDPILWVRAESEASYGGVMRLISELALDTPRLRVALVTANQGAGPVDPVQSEAAWHRGQRFKFPYCVRSGDWDDPVRGRQPL
jgi:biopolymer transport protein ExbD